MAAHKPIYRKYWLPYKAAAGTLKRMVGGGTKNRVKFSWNIRTESGVKHNQSFSYNAEDSGSWWCVLCESMCKQPLMTKPHLSSIISESAVFYLNPQACLMKFRVILCSRWDARSGSLSVLREKTRVAYGTAIIHKSKATLPRNCFYFKMLLELCRLKLLFSEDDKINAPEAIHTAKCR